VAVVTRGALVTELAALAQDAFSVSKHAANLLVDAADYVAEDRSAHARIALTAAQRVLCDSPLGLDVEALHDALVDVLLDERQHTPLPASLFEPQKRIRSADRYADGAIRAFQLHRNWSQADDIADLEMLS